MCVIDRHDMTLAVEVALNRNPTNQPFSIVRNCEFMLRRVLSKITVHIPYVPCTLRCPVINSCQRKLFHFLCNLEQIHSLPNDTILDWSELKAFADDKINVTKELKFVLGREENFVGKGENAGYQHFLLFPQCFQKAFFKELSKVGIV